MFPRNGVWVPCIIAPVAPLGEQKTWMIVSAEHNEEDIRFTVSCKFHLFRSEQEADQFYTGKGAKLTADSILDGLVRFNSTR